MKRAIVVLAVLALAGVGAAAAYQAVARQRDYAALLTRGDAALRDDQTFAAIEAYSGAIALRPDSMLAHLRRGQTYQRRGDRGDLEAAARDFRIAAALDRTATRPLEALGDVLIERHLIGTVAPPPEAVAVARLVHGNAVDPGAQARLTAESVDGAKDAEEDFLRQVERLVAVAEQVHRQLDDHALVIADELGARQLFAGCTPLH